MKTKHNRTFFWLVVGSLSSALGVVLLGVALLLVTLNANAQYSTVHNCGECVFQIDSTEWQPYYKGDINDWVYDEPKNISPDSHIWYVVYCPCCCPKSQIFKEQRISKSTLIKQERTVTHWYRYIPREESEYSKLEKKLNEKSK